MYRIARRWGQRRRLNESPSQKEGKFHALHNRVIIHVASMKAPPKRKGNTGSTRRNGSHRTASMKAKKLYGNLADEGTLGSVDDTSMKAPPKRKGNVQPPALELTACTASMKALPGAASPRGWTSSGLTASPYEKAGKLASKSLNESPQIWPQ